jgi:hypothetical protein
MRSCEANNGLDHLLETAGQTPSLMTTEVKAASPSTPGNHPIPMKLAGRVTRRCGRITEDPTVDARAVVKADFHLNTALQRDDGKDVAVVKVAPEVWPRSNPDPLARIVTLIKLASEEEGLLRDPSTADAPSLRGAQHG